MNPFITSLIADFPREIARVADAFKITNEERLDAWVKWARDWMTHIVETEVHRQGLSDSERAQVADQLVCAYNEVYLIRCEMLYGRASA